MVFGLANTLREAYIVEHLIAHKAGEMNLKSIWNTCNNLTNL